MFRELLERLGFGWLAYSFVRQGLTVIGKGRPIKKGTRLLAEPLAFDAGTLAPDGILLIKLRVVCLTGSLSVELQHPAEGVLDKAKVVPEDRIATLYLFGAAHPDLELIFRSQSSEHPTTFGIVSREVQGYGSDEVEKAYDRVHHTRPLRSRRLWAKAIRRQIAQAARRGPISFLVWERFIDVPVFLNAFIQRATGHRIVIVPKEETFGEFCKDLLPDCTVLHIPHYSFYPQPKANRAQALVNLREARHWSQLFSTAFARIPARTPVIPAAAVGRMRMTQILVALERSQVDTVCITGLDDAAGPAHRYEPLVSQFKFEGARSGSPLDWEPTDDPDPVVTRLMSKACGVDLECCKVNVKSQPLRYNTGNQRRSDTVKPLPVEALRKHLAADSPSFSHDTTNAVLLLESTFRKVRGFDEPRIRRDAGRVFEEIVGQGFAIHVKTSPHTPRETNVDLEKLGDHVRFLPAHIPAEFYLKDYRVILGFVSSTMLYTVPGKKYSLRDMVHKLPSETGPTGSGPEAEGSLTVVDRWFESVSDIDMSLNAETAREIVASWRGPNGPFGPSG